MDKPQAVAVTQQAPGKSEQNWVNSITQALEYNKKSDSSRGIKMYFWSTCSWSETLTWPRVEDHSHTEEPSVNRLKSNILIELLIHV